MTKYKTIRNIIFFISSIIFLIFIFRNQYIYDVSLQKCFIFVLINSIFIFISNLTINEEKTYKASIYLYIILYFFILISATFIIGRMQIGFYSWWYSGQYVPFHTITSQLKYASTRSFIKNIVGNSLMLIPLSFLLMIKNKKNNNFLRQTLIILPVIVTIEVLQAFTHAGAFDIDDIILNYSGALVFTFLITRFNIINKIRELFYIDFKLSKNIKKIMFYIFLILVITYDILLLIK